MVNTMFLGLLAAALLCCATGATAQANGGDGGDLWKLARSKRAVHRFSTLFTAQDVRDRLSTEAGLDAAIAWCRRTGVTKAYVEAFRDGYQAERHALLHAAERLRAAGVEVSGCVTTTRVGKPSTGWKDVASCFTDPATQEHLEQIFTYAASLFDEIMIDDFWFTDCQCPSCDAARHARTVTVGDRTYPVSGDGWSDYRCELMTRLSEDRILAPARRVNPKVRLIIKYPQWYDGFHDRGYDVARETAAFDRTWVGTETRDPDNAHWGKTQQYEAYFIMRWLGGIGGAKCGGGWYDPYGTSPQTYAEQGRQTVLAGARESMLFCYGSLTGDNGPQNVEALRAQMPELFTVAAEVRRRKPVGIAAYKPPNSPAYNERRVFDYLGMIGLPLAPCHRFPASAPAAFFSVHALKDVALPRKLAVYIATGRPTLVTDDLAARLEGRVNLSAPNVHVLQVEGRPERLLHLSQAELDALRPPFLHALGVEFKAPSRVALYLFADRSRVIENFNDAPVTVSLDGESVVVKPRAWTQFWTTK